MSRLLPDGAIDTLGVRAVVTSTPDRVAGAWERGLGAVSRTDRGVVVVADGPLAIAAHGALAVAPEPASPVIVVGPGAVPRFADLGWAVVEVASLLEAPIAPRFDVAAGVAAVLGAGTAAGLFDAEDAVSSAVDQLRRRLAGTSDRAAALATRMAPLVPLVYGAGPLGAAAAAHWKLQVNLNAKAPAFATGLVEPVHSELSGWGQHGDVTRQVFTLVVLRHDHEPERVHRAMPAIEELVGEVVHARDEVVAEGVGAAAQLLDLVAHGDLVSLELAARHEIDPGPTGVESLLPPD